MTDTVDVAAQEVDPLADKIVSLKYSVKDVNGIINMMNTPLQTPVMAWANLIANIQAQCAPQIEALNANAETPSEPQTAA